GGADPLASAGALLEGPLGGADLVVPALAGAADGAGPDRREAVVAVVAEGRVPRRPGAELDSVARSVTVAVLVPVHGDGDAVVDRAVAVVVDAVADLRLAGIDAGLEVVAVGSAAHAAAGLHVAAPLVDVAVAVRVAVA